MGVLSGLLLMGLLAQDSVRTEAHADGEAQVRELLDTAEQSRLAGNYVEGLLLAERAITEAEALEDPALIVEAQYQTALLHHYMEHYDQARSHLEVGLAMARVHDLKALEADLLNAIGILEWKQGNLGPAGKILSEALAIWEHMGNGRNMANVSNNLGLIAYSRKEYRKAARHYRDGIEWMEPDASDRLRASLYSNLAEALIPLDELDEAEKYLDLSLKIEERENDPHNLAYTYFNFGELRVRQGKSAEAIRLFRKALDLQLSIENDWAVALTRLRIAEEYTRSGDTESALMELMPGYEALKKLNALSLLRDYSDLFARLYEKRGETGRARYYRDLNKWFSERMNADTGPDEAALEPSTTETASTKPSPFLSTVRAATLGLLGIMIIILFLENMRLRKLMQPDG